MITKLFLSLAATLVDGLPREADLRVIAKLLLTLAATCLLSIPANWMARTLARRVGLVDRPDGHRKLQMNAVPLAGGVAIFFSAVLTISALMVFDPQLWGDVFEFWSEALSVLCGSVIILGVGLFDDARGLRGRQKLLGQLAAILVIVVPCKQLWIHNVSILGWPIELGDFGVLLTVFWLLGAINALNLLDGIDGLVATLSIVMCAAIAIMANEQHASISLISVVLAGCLIGFLRFNFPPASMYLGDAGSMLLGLLFGVLAIQTSLKTDEAYMLAVPVALWTIPIFDSTAAILRRKLTGRSIYSTDRAHFHHRLLKRLGHRKSLACVAGVSLLTSGAALISVIQRNDLWAILVAGAVVSIFVALRVFGHSELLLLLVRIRGMARSLVSRPSDKKDMVWDDSVRMQGTRQWELLWESLTEWAVRLEELVHVRLDVNVPRLGEGYHASWCRPNDGNHDEFWRLELPLIADDKVMGSLKLVGDRMKPSWQNLDWLLDLLDQIEVHVRSIASAEIDAERPVHLPEPAVKEWILSGPILEPGLRAIAGPMDGRERSYPVNRVRQIVQCNPQTAEICDE